MVYSRMRIDLAHGQFRAGKFDCACVCYIIHSEKCLIKICRGCMTC